MQFLRNIELCKRWLILGVVALACAGLLSIATVLLRSPALNTLISGSNIFDAALIIHVDLSVLVWMLSMTTVLWSTMITSQYLHIAKSSWYIALMGVILIALSIFVPESELVKNNYIPIVHNFIFLLGLGTFSSSIITNAILVTVFSKPRNSIEIGIYCSAVFVLLAFCAMLFAYQSIPNGIDIYDFYEYLFWGGGHILQFTYTQVLVLLYIFFLKVKTSKALNIIFITNFIFVAPAFSIYFLYPVYDYTLVDFFTKHMSYIGGFLPIIILIYSLKNFRMNFNYQNTALLWSIALFIYGGWLGTGIQEVNVTIPAHYHGSIVGITISLIGFAYMLLPNLGFAPVNNKLANTQIFIYGVGQALHIAGLAWMGGYGALRKTAGMELPTEAYIGRIIFIIGGALAVVAGLMFVILMIRSFYRLTKDTL